MSVVDLPAPFAPIIATISPGSTVSETPCRTLIGPYPASSFSTSRRGGIVRRPAKGYRVPRWVANF